MLTTKSNKDLYQPSRSQPVLVGLVLAFFWIAPTGHNVQLALVRAVQGKAYSETSHTFPTPCEPRSDGKNKLGQPGEIGTFYRRTKNGWEDSSKWRIRNEPIPQQLDAVHPAVWTLLVVGLVFLVLLGCSKQTEIDRLFDDLNQFFERIRSDP